MLGLAAALACGGDARREEAQTTSDEAAALVLQFVTLNTFITSSIEIDQFTPGSTIPDDANLFTGNDPADGSLSKAAPGSGTFIDWNDLANDAANHQILDLDDPALRKDPTSFPLSNECVGASQVLSKMDLTYVAAANNRDYAYFAVQRANNSGDAGYYWLFTKLQPSLNKGEAPCKAEQYRLVYNISENDVLLAGHFKPNGTPLLRFFKANKALSGVSAVNAVDFTSGLWTENQNAIAAVAVNSTNTAAGALGAAGVLATAGTTTTGGTTILPEIFAEAAVGLAAFVNGNTCDAEFFGSVITRSSGSGGTSPDLKDLAGPAKFNFRPLTATASLAATCGTTVSYEARATTDGVTPTCEWTFDDGQTSTSCKGSITMAPGSHTGTVKVSDGATGCTQTKTTTSVLVSDALSAEAALVPTCSLDYTYSSTVKGGSAGGTLSYAWTFTNSNTTSSTDASGTNTSSAAGQVTASLTVTDKRTDGSSCTATANTSTTTHDALKATATLTPSCDAGFGYSSTVSGGDGSAVQYAWTFTSSPGGAVFTPSSSSTTASGSVTVDLAGTYTGDLVVTQTRADVPEGKCSAEDSKSVAAFKQMIVGIQLTPTCGPSFDYSFTVKEGSGGYKYAWTFTGPAGAGPSPASSTAPSGSVASSGAGGTYGASLVVTDSRGCAAQKAEGTANAYPGLGLTPALTGGCQSQFSYSSTPTGGSGSYGYAWTFKNAAGDSLGTSTSQSGGPIGTGALGTGGGTFTGDVTVTDLRGDKACSIAKSASTQVFSPIAVHLTPSRTGASCPGLTADTVTYSATITGGSAGYAGSAFGLAWTGQACTGTSCTIDPSDSTFCVDQSLYLTVTDPLCPTATSETERYQKLTQIIATDNP